MLFPTKRLSGGRWWHFFLKMASAPGAGVLFCHPWAVAHRVRSNFFPKKLPHRVRNASFPTEGTRTGCAAIFSPPKPPKPGADGIFSPPRAPAPGAGHISVSGKLPHRVRNAFSLIHTATGWFFAAKHPLKWQPGLLWEGNFSPFPPYPYLYKYIHHIKMPISTAFFIKKALPLPPNFKGWHFFYADVAKLADALDLGSSAARHVGSTPIIRTDTKVGKWGIGSST